VLALPGDHILAWCMSSRRWRRATATSRGTISARIVTFCRPDTSKCLHYYFYFIDAELGLIYLRRANLVSVSLAVLLQ
jgi:hypothetical protein